MRTLLACALALTTVACATPAPSVIYLVRHAEKAPDPGDGDPDLSDVGRARAEALARALADSPPDQIWVTHLVRTQQTAAPTAAQAGKTPEILPAQDVDGLLARLRAVPAGTRVLVVGHSNTLPDLIAGLGLGRVEIRSGDYDDLFVVVAAGDARRLERVHFGAEARDAGAKGQ